MNDETQQKMYTVSQQEAAYISVSTTRGKACGNCRWFCVSEEGAHCHLVDSWPDYILATGYCNRWEGKPVPEEPEVNPLPVVIVEPPEPEMEMALSPEREQNLLDKLTATIRKTFGKKPDGVFTVYRDASGKPRWIGKFTNNFKDRFRTIVSEKAIDGYLSRVEMGLIPMPLLRVGHIPGSEHGHADMVFGVGNFVVGVGSFDDSDFAQVCLSYYEKNASKVSLSQGFITPKWAKKDGVYEVMNTFEISVLPPPMVAANPYTEFEVEVMKQIRPDQLEALAAVVGSKEKAQELVAKWETESEELKALGVEYRDFADVDAAQADKKPEAVNPNFAEVFLAFMEDQGASVEIMKAFQKRQDTFEQAQAALEQKIAATVEAQVADVKKALTDATALIEQLKAERAVAPRIASEDDATSKDITAEMAAKLKEQLPENNGYDPFYGEMKIRK